MFSEYLSWRWIFFVNIPLGAARGVDAAAAASTRRSTRAGTAIDYAGAVLLTVGCSLLILGLLEGGVAWAWGSPASIAVFVVGAAAARRRSSSSSAGRPSRCCRCGCSGRACCVGGNLAAAARRRAADRADARTCRRSCRACSAPAPLVAGLALAALTIGWPIAAALAGRLYLRLGFRDTALIGSAVVVLGTVLCRAAAGVARTSGRSRPACFVVGVGLGLTNVPTLVAAQSVVGWEHRGVVTGTNMFSRSIGSAVGVAVFGAVANATLSHHFANPPPGVEGHLPASVDAASDVIGNTGGASGVSEQVVAFVREALFQATHHVFLGLVVVAIGLMAAVMLIPRHTSELDVEALGGLAQRTADGRQGRRDLPRVVGW